MSYTPLTTTASTNGAIVSRRSSKSLSVLAGLELLERPVEEAERHDLIGIAEPAQHVEAHPPGGELIGGRHERVAERSVGAGVQPAHGVGTEHGSSSGSRVGTSQSRPRGRCYRSVGGRCALHQRSSIRASSSSAPALASGSLRLPHFGDWTHDGQPRSQRHSKISRCASPTSVSKRGKPCRVIPTPPGWPS